MNIGVRRGIARTFQDRSHNFILMPREMHQIPNDFDIENIQVRGKRGNIVQTFPAVEYDFQPQNPIVTTNSMIHFQWTGCLQYPLKCFRICTYEIEDELERENQFAPSIATIQLFLV